MNREPTTFDLIFRHGLIVLALRVAWQTWPGLPFCLLFWAYSKFGDSVFRSGLVARRRGLHVIAFVGGTLNAVATIANGGHMPVLGGGTEAGSLWIPLTAASHLPWLCDIYGKCSLGDMFIGVAVAGFLLNWMLEKSDILEVSTHGERMPGLGVG